MNTPVNFELAKLLKEKGFDELCIAYWQSDNSDEPTVSSLNKTTRLSEMYLHRNTFLSLSDTLMVIPNEEDFDKDVKLNPQKYKRVLWGIKIAAPTIAEVIMWLYEKHELWIIVGFSGDETCYSMVTNKICDVRWNNKGFKSPTEAYEASIDYTLNNLI